MNHSHFFSAYSILKLLFKKRSNAFVGRFHETFPITVKNPITNQRIVGEVEFYKIANPRIEDSGENLQRTAPVEEPKFDLKHESVNQESAKKPILLSQND